MRHIKKYNVHATIEKGKRFLYRARARDEIIGIEKKGGNSAERKKNHGYGKTRRPSLKEDPPFFKGLFFFSEQMLNADGKGRTRCLIRKKIRGKTAKLRISIIANRIVNVELWRFREKSPPKRDFLFASYKLNKP